MKLSVLMVSDLTSSPKGGDFHHPASLGSQSGLGNVNPQALDLGLRGSRRLQPHLPPIPCFV